MRFFKRRTNDEMADHIARYLPNDRTFAAKNIDGTNLRSFLKGLAHEYMRANELIEEYATEMLPDQTVRFISEWESVVGIPDSCFTGTGSNDERRRDVLVKIAMAGAQTGLDFENIASIFGITTTVVPGIDSGEVFSGGDTEARFTIVVDVTVDSGSGFPYPFPLPFASSAVGLLNCIFNQIKQANGNVLVREVSP